MRLAVLLVAGQLGLVAGWGQGTNLGLPTVSIQVLSNAAEYGTVTGAFAVVRTGPFDQALEVEYQVGGTASNGWDYARLPGQVLIPAGQASALIPVRPLDDREWESAETVRLTLAPRSRPFSLVVLPDTQYYSAGYPWSSPDMFTAQTRWIAALKDELNIAFVLHEGDITDRNIEMEWERARASMSLLDGVVPYAMAVGNHDGLMTHVSQTALFNQFFSITNFLNRPSFGGVFETNRMDNCYHLFSAGGVDWLILALEFGPRDAVLAWANQVVANYPDRRVILLTHSHVYTDNTLHGSSSNHLWMPTSYGRENNGVEVWEKLLRRQPNSALAFNGHVLLSGTGRVVGTNDFGRRVFQMLANYQVDNDGGGGYLRLVQFFPEEDRMRVQTYSPYRDAWRSDGENQFGYTNLGFFAGASAGYRIDADREAASLVITNDDLSFYPPEVQAVSYVGLPPVFKLAFDMPLERASAETLTNYSLGKGARLVAARLSADQRSVLLTPESNLVEGVTYALTANYLRNQARGIQQTNRLFHVFSYHAVLMVEDFSDGDSSAFTIVDEGALDGSSSWVEQNGRLFQLSHIYGPDLAAPDHRQGTFAYWNAPEALGWSNYAATVAFKNNNGNGVGLLVRYQNPSNYYKVELDAQQPFRKLFKRVDGVETTLAAEPAGYVPGQDNVLRVMVTNAEIRVRLNGVLLFGGSVQDASLSTGTVGLYSWASQSLSFSNLTVAPPYRVPLVSITNPVPTAVFNQFSVIPISVTAMDVDGKVTQVEILDGTNRLGLFWRPPYLLNWADAGPGEHTIVAKATDNTGLTGVGEVSIEVTPVYLMPSWVQQPQSQQIPAGGGVLLAAKALGTEPLSYQWYFNDLPIAEATHQLFYLNALNPDHAGSYWATVRNPSWCVTSQVAVLSVLETTNSAGNDVPAFQRLTIADLDERRTPVLALESEPQAPITIQAATTLATNWVELLRVTNSSRPFYFREPVRSSATNSAGRFYRAVRTF